MISNTTEESSASIFKMDATNSTEVEVMNLNWRDSSTFPKETVDVIIGADLVYDVGILQMLVPAIDGILSKGNYTLFLPNKL